MKPFKQFIIDAIGVKKYYGMGLQKFITRRLKWVNIGSGSFASIWKIPGKSYVAKIWTSDSSYESFLRYIVQHPNPHFPKVFGRMKAIPAFYKRSRKEEVIKVIKMEMLDELDNDNRRFISQFGRALEKEPKMHSSKRAMYRAMNPQTDSLYEAFTAMLPHISGELDLHTGNFMQRADGTIVIIDPLFDEDEMTDLSAKVDEPEIYLKPHYIGRENQPSVTENI